MDNLPVLALSNQKNDLLYNKLAEKSPGKMQAARDMVPTLNFSKTHSVLAFGVSSQKGLVDFTDSVLTNIRSGDAGPTGQLMANLKGKILDLDVRGLPQSTGGKLSAVAADIPVIGGWLSAKVDAARAFIRRYEVLKIQIDDITRKLEAEKTNQIEHLNRLDTLYERNEEYFDALEVTIAAGELKMVEMEGQFEQQRQTFAAQSAVDAKELQVSQRFRRRHSVAGSPAVQPETCAGLCNNLRSDHKDRPGRFQGYCGNDSGFHPDDDPGMEKTTGHRHLPV